MLDVDKWIDSARARPETVSPGAALSSDSAHSWAPLTPQFDSMRWKCCCDTRKSSRNCCSTAIDAATCGDIAEAATARLAALRGAAFAWTGSREGDLATIGGMVGKIERGNVNAR